jgi:hypothetical protein
MCEAAGAPGDIVPDAGHSWLLADPEGFGELVTNSLSVQRTLTDRTGGHTGDHAGGHGDHGEGGAPLDVTA